MIKAIVYTSKTGHTYQYAKLISEAISIPAYSLSEALKSVEKGSDIIYLGWLFASNVKGLGKAMKRFNICCVCGVGLTDTGQLLTEVRNASKLDEAIPLFTLQGGIDKTKLKGINKLLINMLTNGLAKQQQKSAQDERMLYLLKTSENLVKKENLNDFFSWYKQYKN